MAPLGPRRPQRLGPAGALLSEQARELIGRTPFAGIRRLPWPRLWLPVARRRQRAGTEQEAMEVAAARGVVVQREQIAGVPVRRLTPGHGDSSGTLVYFHGGAHVMGTPLDVTSVLLCEGTGCTVLSVDYPLAPEHPYPGALRAAEQVWVEVTDRDPGPVGLAGLSAGGNLALALMLRILRRDLARPAVLGLMTPWTDAALIGDSHETNRGRDPVLASRWQIEMAATLYLNGASATHPLISPVHADRAALEGWPPTMITTGTRDLLLSDATRMYWRLREVTDDVHLRLWEGMWHGFTSEPDLPEGIRGRAELCGFLVRELRTASEATR